MPIWRKTLTIKRLDVCFASLLLMVGLWIIAQAIGYGITGPNIAEPGFFPLIAGILLAGSALGTIIKLVRTAEGNEAPDFSGAMPVLGSICTMLVYLLLLDTLGMVLLSPFFIFAIGWFIERPKNIRQGLGMVAVALGFTAFAYVLFGHLLRVPLPRGIFGI